MCQTPWCRNNIWRRSSRNLICIMGCRKHFSSSFTINMLLHGIQNDDSIFMLYQTTKLARDANSLRLKASHFSWTFKLCWRSARQQICSHNLLLLRLSNIILSVIELDIKVVVCLNMLRRAWEGMGGYSFKINLISGQKSKASSPKMVMCDPGV